MFMTEDFQGRNGAVGLGGQNIFLLQERRQFLSGRRVSLSVPTRALRRESCRECQDEKNTFEIFHCKFHVTDVEPWPAALSPDISLSFVSAPETFLFDTRA